MEEQQELKSISNSSHRNTQSIMNTQENLKETEEQQEQLNNKHNPPNTQTPINIKIKN